MYEFDKAHWKDIYKVFVGFIILFMSIVSYAQNIGFYKMTEQLLHDRLGNNELELDIIFSSKSKYQEILRKQNDISSINIMNISGANFKILINYHNNSSEETVGRFNSFLHIPVVKKYTKSGTKILEQDIVLQRLALNQIPRDAITSTMDIIGMQVKRNIHSNSILKDTDIIKPQIINKNDVINVKYQTNKIHLRTTATALSSGAISDIIKLKNNKTGVIITGKIIADKTVRVIY